MTKGTVALVVSTGILAVASVGLGIKFKTLESELTRARSTESNRVEQLVARQHRLELTNARLREEIARLGRAVSADGADDSPPEQRGRAVDSETIRELLRQAEDAFVNRDAAAFRDTFLALVDVGPAAHAGLIELLRVTGNYNELFGEIAPDDYDFRREFLDEVTRRRLQLGSLADAILTRDGEPDRATLFAYDLLKWNGVMSERPIDEQAATFLSLLERALDSEDAHFDPRSHNQQVLWPAELLGKTGLRDALPELRELLTLDGLSENNRIFLAQSAARLGGSAAVDLLRELHDSSSAAIRGRLMGNVAIYDYGDPEVESFLRELGETSPDPNVQSEVRDSLDRREKDLERLVARLDDDAASTGRQRMEVIDTLLRRGDESQREAAWAHFERAGDQFQDEMLASIANTEERALELLLERFDGDRVSRELAGSIVRLDTKLVHANRERIARAAGDVSLSLRTRAAAAVALGKVDPDVAVRALTPGFEAGSETERIEVVETIKRRIGGDEAAAFLNAIATTDGSERVRAAAAQR